MRLEVEFSDLGKDDVDEATVSCWYFEEDEAINEGEDLVEMLTEKAAFNITAPVTGQLVEILVQEGDVVKVGDVVAIIESAEEDEEDEEEEEED
jgi:pyruvate dehydrogenase E2 component (dihydrolipoamide acetyltransferase)